MTVLGYDTSEVTPQAALRVVCFVTSDESMLTEYSARTCGLKGLRHLLCKQDCSRHEIDTSGSTSYCFSNSFIDGTKGLI